jgi:hypothetical protein
VAGSTATSRVYVPVVVTELPDGWTVSERTRLSSPSGIDVELRLDRLQEGPAARPATDADGFETVSEGEVAMFGGRVGHERRVSCERDGVGWSGRVVSMVEAGVVLTATAWWESSVPDADADVSRAIAGVRLRSRPVIAVPGAEAVERANVAPPQAEETSWALARSAWQGSSPALAATVDVGRWSAPELAVCAMVLGAPAFPTIGPLLASLEQASLAATVEVVTRSFMARRLIARSDDGSTALVEQLGWMTTAVYPDLTISLEVSATDGSTMHWIGLRSSRAVCIDTDADATRACHVMDSTEVIGHILALIGAKPDVSAAEDRTRVDAGVLSEEATRGTRFVRVTTNWREGDLIRGGEITCVIDVDGAAWLAEVLTGENTPMWNLRAVDVATLRATVLDHLPGA